MEMERVRMNEVDTREEIVKVFNRIIDKLNESDVINADIDVFNAEVAEFNKAVEKGA